MWKSKEWDTKQLVSSINAQLKDTQLELMASQNKSH